MKNVLVMLVVSMALSASTSCTAAHALQPSAEVATVNHVPDPSFDAETRHLVYVQGLNSQSACEKGKGFVDKAPRWLNDYLSVDRRPVAKVALDEPAYFSYSGRYCADGVTPLYAKSDTCAGIQEHAARLRGFIERRSAKSVLIAHSMGGVIAAYLVGSDPPWAQQHIASIVTFDSPLQGVGLGVLAIGIARLPWEGLFGFQCDILRPASQGMIDYPGLDEQVLAVVRNAPSSGIPFYAIDAVKAERYTGFLFELIPVANLAGAEQLPGWRVFDNHNSVWNCRYDASQVSKRDARGCPTAGHDKAHLVTCAVLVPKPCTQAAPSGADVQILSRGSLLTNATDLETGRNLASQTNQAQ
jgi:pimeloyl-ACP methyl ester carboxylesterase